MKNNNLSNIVDKTVEHTRTTMNSNIGGPFGSAIMDKAGNEIVVASNSVLADHDPTAHAEVNAIRQACKKLKTHDLSDYTLYATGYPCPMCLSAIIWANIKHVIYGCRLQDTEKIGFRDDFIYNFIKGNNSNTKILEINEEFRDKCLPLFDEYNAKRKSMY